MQISHLSLIHKLILEWFRGLFNIDFRKDEMIMQNHPFWNDSLSLSSFSLPTKNESFSRIFMLVHRFSSWFMMTMTHFSSFSLPLAFVINPLVIEFNPRIGLYKLRTKCWIPKIKTLIILITKIQNTIKMFSNDDYEFEDLANQMSQTQLNENGTVGGLSML